MYEVDFLPVENGDRDAGGSGDAITIRFTVESEHRDAVVVIDGGRPATSEHIAGHINRYYRTDRVDLVISTHPDPGHLGGLAGLFDLVQVDELMIHQPALHAADISGFPNRESLEKLLARAREAGVRMTEPFAGESRLDGQLTILGPTRAYYEELLEQQLRGTPTYDGGTSPRNNSSAITLLTVDGERLLFTGDAGTTALEAAADRYESVVGPFRSHPLEFLQVPHHGSDDNLGPDVLDRLTGSPRRRRTGSRIAFISSAKAAPQHPSPGVVDALKQRGWFVGASDGRRICYRSADPVRPDWLPLTGS